MLVKYQFSIGTRYVNSTVKDTVEVDIPDDATEDETEAIVEEAWKEWIWQEIDGGWKKL